MLRMMKLRFAVIAMVAIVLTLLVQPSLAYYTTVGIATNVVTSGNIRLKIHETTDQGTPFPEEGVYVIPGDVVSKVVTIENDCEHPFYLRVKVTSGSSTEGISADDCFKLNINFEHWTYKDGWIYYNYVLKPGQTSLKVFSKVLIVGETVDNSFIGATLNLTVLAQAVQSENNPIIDGDITTVQGWPAEE